MVVKKRNKSIFLILGHLEVGQLWSELGTLSSSLKYLKNPKLKSLFISRLGPDVSASHVENFLQEHLKLSSLTCTKVKTKFNSYLSFHVPGTEDDFHLVNDSGAWPTGCA
jgi:hypothetical protein